MGHLANTPDPDSHARRRSRTSAWADLFGIAAVVAAVSGGYTGGSVRVVAIGAGLASLLIRYRPWIEQFWTPASTGVAAAIGVGGVVWSSSIANQVIGTVTLMNPSFFPR